jgi:hypothetical protein
VLFIFRQVFSCMSDVSFMVPFSTSANAAQKPEPA